MRLKEDSSSWRASGIVRRDFRHDPGMPETEIPKHRKLKRSKVKHVHEYKRVFVGNQDARRAEYTMDLDGNRRFIGFVDCTIAKYHFVCETCGNKKSHFFGWWR